MSVARSSGTAPGRSTGTPTSTSGIPIYLIDDANTKIADNYADLWDGSIDAKIDVTATGAAPPEYLGASPGVWTGTLADGEIFPLARLGRGTVSIGTHSISSTFQWIRWASASSSGPIVYPLYAMSPVLVNGAPVSTYSVGGDVSGLSGTVTLQNNGGDDLDVSAIGGFTFLSELTDTSAYAVTVQTDPAGQTCTVTGGGAGDDGTGTIATADVTNVVVTCADDVAPPPPPPPPENSYTNTLPSGATGTLSFTTADAACTFAGSAQFLDTVTPAPPASIVLVDGVISFTISGCTPGATVEISMDYGSTLPAGSNPWKAGSPWYQLSGSVSGSVMTYSLTDGVTGDDDGVVNGTIVDPSGAATSAGVTTPASSGPVTPVPTMPVYALILTILGLLFAARGPISAAVREV